MRLSGCDCQFGALGAKMVRMQTCWNGKKEVDLKNCDPQPAPPPPVVAPAPPPPPVVAPAPPPPVYIDRIVHTPAPPPPVIAARESYVPEVRAAKADVQNYVIEPLAASGGGSGVAPVSEEAPEIVSEPPAETNWLLLLAIGVALYKFAT